ncbi:MAG: PDZ domain-containing protein [Erythrobacter sp.]|nr:PDZ domain-containing protein [Erythrobacter sp.]NCQ62558.1 PDZ domain-containing protein [Alphaproteobacteria bacterium]
MRRNIACPALMLAMLLGSQSATAHDAGAPEPGTEQASRVEDLLDMMRGLPDLRPEFDTSQPVVGFGYQIADGEVVIARVLDGSAAEAAGLRVGMIIEKINGARLGTFTLEEIAKLIAAIDGVITFTVRDTGDVTLRKAPIEQQGS